MKCIIHLLSARGDAEAVYVFAGYSVCDDDACLDAVGDTMHDTIMNADRIESES